MTTDVASDELLQVLIRGDELYLMRMGEAPPREPEAAKHWTRAHTARRAELEQLTQRKADRYAEPAKPKDVRRGAPLADTLVRLRLLRYAIGGLPGGHYPVDWWD
jgi:hypothetical protein